MYHMIVQGRPQGGGLVMSLELISMYQIINVKEQSVTHPFTDIFNPKVSLQSRLT